MHTLTSSCKLKWHVQHLRHSNLFTQIMIIPCYVLWKNSLVMSQVGWISTLLKCGKWHYLNPLISCSTCYSCKPNCSITHAFSINFRFFFYSEQVSVQQEDQALSPLSRLRFSSSLWHSQADEARQAGHTKADSPDDGHANQAICRQEQASVSTRGQITDQTLLWCSSDGLLPFFKALSMSFSSSRACLFPGSFLRRVRMYFKAFSYSWGMKQVRGIWNPQMRRFWNI